MVFATHLKPTCQIKFVNGIDQRLECPICKNVFSEPWQTSCGHRFCRNCFGGLFGLENPKCPIDGEPISREDSFRDKCCEREVLNLQCFCRYKERSCDWKGEIRHCKVHEESCQYGDTKCAACNETMKRRHLKQHRENDCVNRAVACTYCGGEVRQSNMKDHMEVCLKFPISCIQNCGKEDILRGMMEEHVTTYCPKAEHLCHFSTHGCEFQGNAEQFSEHMKSSSESHLVMMNYSTQEQNKKIKEMEEKVSRLENEKRTFEQQIRSQTEELAAALQNIQLECNRQLDRAGHQMALHEIQLSQQDMQLQMLEATSYNGTYVWKIDHYSRRFQEAASGQTLLIHSPPFYVGRFGYKVCAHLYPNGDGVGKGTHMSMYFVIMRGEYDAILPWPFIQKVHFKLIDQERIRDAYDAFRPEPHGSSFKRPTSGMNIASGCPTFISHTELRQGGFIRNDTIFVKITVDMTGLQGVSTVVKPQPCTQDFP